MKQTKEIKNFIFSQYFTDGLRITFGVLLPPLLFAQAGHLETGIVVSLGAITTSIPDNPGPVSHKRNGMLASIAFMIFTALLTGLINQHPTLLVLEIFLLCFFFSMFSIYGNRASSIGTGVLIIMVLTIDRHFSILELLQYAGLLLIGGVWYVGLSVAISQFQPYRMAQQSLGECIGKVSSYLKLKANFYDPQVNIDSNYKKLIDQQIIVHQQQDVVREILFKTRMITKEPTNTARLLILLFSDIVDLFEQSMATHYDYKEIHSSFKGLSVLREFQVIIQNIADELENIGQDVTANERPRPLHNFQPQLEQLKYHIDMVDNNLVLKKILINVRNIINRIHNIYSYFNQTKLEPRTIGTEKDLGRFVSHQTIDLKLFRDNLGFDSSVFRHSVRVAIVCVIGYLVGQFTTGSHSYWILLTILVILKPAFSLTKERNYQRLIGTFIGGLAGALIIHFVDDHNLRFAFLLVFMILAYSFQRLNYVVSVLFLTPFILIMLSFIGFGSLSIVRERIIDTFIGSFIALLASNFIFPAWEYRNLKSHMKKLLIANYNYLAEAAKMLAGKGPDLTEYKLARKEVYVHSANMASALQRMLSEPKSKQKDVKEVNKFIVLNHTLSSYIATLISSVKHGETNQETLITLQHIKNLRKSLYLLCEGISGLSADEAEKFKEADLRFLELTVSNEESVDTKLISEQLEFIHTVSGDLLKIVQKMKNEEKAQVPSGPAPVIENV
ncbi:FUSC family protein [Desertivirga xinjiangensis]|uniref:FUSC family protein n=1 Tax=Desertivirga xinjiangensis TaxID=539206 RepID=UPI00210B14F0|nr:FUSC family membrane protein [Pedobacter xinjiangensis]